MSVITKKLTILVKTILAIPHANRAILLIHICRKTTNGRKCKILKPDKKPGEGVVNLWGGGEKEGTGDERARRWDVGQIRGRLPRNMFG